MPPSFLRIFSSALLVSATLGANAQYSNPESVEHDPVGDRYFVSNTGNGKIRQRDQAGTVTDFVTVSPAPYGIEIMDTAIYACSGGTVKGYALSTGAQVFNLNLGGNFLNGITTDGTFLYVTDFGNDEILKVDVAGNTFSPLASTSFTPNGIVYDPVGDRLVVVAWGGNAPITQVDKNTGAQSLLINSGFSNIDGITIDCLGRFITANWGNDQLHAFPADFSTAGISLGAAGLANPADIDFDEVNGRVCVANAGNNTITLFDVAACINGLEEPEVSNGVVFPNPTHGLVRLAGHRGALGGVQVLDASGRLVLSTVAANGVIDLSTLVPGLYSIVVPRSGIHAQVVLR
ncbi:MAG: T9SS type A sorting domain-containing protein [Flavobacteriales bacterium]|nr:MAG: T9SS type A sorting domain-containing protein [Flavobacteriales bacterium]